MRKSLFAGKERACNRDIPSKSLQGAAASFPQPLHMHTRVCLAAQCMEMHAQGLLSTSSRDPHVFTCLVPSSCHHLWELWVCFPSPRRGDRCVLPFLVSSLSACTLVGLSGTRFLQSRLRAEPCRGEQPHPFQLGAALRMGSCILLLSVVVWDTVPSPSV